jgi:hypothetical protein
VTTGTLNSLMVFQIGGGIMALISGFGQFLTKQILTWQLKWQNIKLN